MFTIIIIMSTESINFDSVSIFHALLEICNLSEYSLLLPFW